jgi:hypothetical protein
MAVVVSVAGQPEAMTAKTALMEGPSSYVAGAGVAAAVDGQVQRQQPSHPQTKLISRSASGHEPSSTTTAFALSKRKDSSRSFIVCSQCITFLSLSLCATLFFLLLDFLLGAAQLSGFDPKISFRDVVNFWNANAPGGLRYVRLSVQDGHARVTLKASQISGALAALQGRQISPGHPLIVQLGTASGSALGSVEREGLRAHVRANFNADSKALNLQSLAQQGCSFANFQSTAFITELFNTIAASASEAVSINLAGNAIQSLAAFTGLLHVAPKLQNLSLANNFLPSVEQVEHLVALKDTLRELVLSGNPFNQTFTASPGVPLAHPQQLDYQLYQQYIASLFPALVILDGQRLAGLIEFDLPQALAPGDQTKLPPVETSSSFFDSESNQNVSLQPVKQYLQLYDSDRQNTKLAAVYHEKALFSLTYQPDARHSQPKYTEQNRNIVLLSSAGTKARATQELALLRQGPLKILAALADLPTSAHDIDSIVADVCHVPSANPNMDLLRISMLGQFLEAGSIMRCYHRTFLCVAPSADAQAKGWPVQILHDTLYVGTTKPIPIAAPVERNPQDIMAAATAADAAAAALTPPAMNGLQLSDSDRLAMAAV